MPLPVSRQTAMFIGALALAGIAVWASPAQFASTWREPSARADFEGKKIAAFFLSSNQDMRQAAENAMARELTSAGARGLRGYELLTTEVAKDVEKALDALRNAGVEGVILTRILEPTVQPPTVLTPDTTPGYASLSAYWGSAWAAVTDPGNSREAATARVETIFYAASDGKPVWAGIGDIKGSENLTQSVVTLAEATATELTRRSIIRKRP